MHIIIPVRSGEPVDLAAVREYVDTNFPPVFDYFEKQAPDGAAIVDDRFGIADISLAAPVRLLELAGNPLDPIRWPRFAAYVRKILDRPSAVALRHDEEVATEIFRTTGNAPR